MELLLDGVIYIVRKDGGIRIIYSEIFANFFKEAVQKIVGLKSIKNQIQKPV